MRREIIIEPEAEDYLDDEKIWMGICEMAAKRTGISAKRAKALLESEGFDAYDHTGIVEALEVVEWRMAAQRRGG